MKAPAKKAPSRKSVSSDIELDIFFKKDGLYYDSEKCNILMYVDKDCPENVVMDDRCSEIKERYSMFPTQVKSVIVSKNIENIQTNTFNFCRNLENIVLPENLKVIGKEAFGRCGSLTEINLPENLEIIRTEAFRNTALKELTLPDSLIELGSGAFYCCDELKTVKIGKSLDTINSRAFSSCYKLTSVDLANVNTIGEGAFMYCKLTEVSIYSHSGTVDFGPKVFVNCYSLTNVVFGDDTTMVYRYSLFTSCNKLASITLPVTMNYYDSQSNFYPNSLEHSIFDDCASLSTVNYTGTIAQWSGIDQGKTYHWYDDIPVTVVHCTDGDVNVK